MAEPSDEGIFREINEELRNEQFTKAWKNYGRYIVAGVVVVIASVAGYKGWQNYDISSRGEQGERFAASISLSRDGNSEAALDELAALNSDAGGGYRMLSAFKAAALMADRGDRRGAADAYDRLAADSSLQAVYRDLARLLGVIQSLNEGNLDAAALTARLAPLSVDDNPWRHSARELLAVMAEQSGDKARALELFGALSEDTSAPQGIRRRAAEMLAALSS